MPKNYKTIKVLAAHTLIVASFFPLYGSADVQLQPSIELNFDVLQKLSHPVVTPPTVINNKNPEPTISRQEVISTQKSPLESKKDGQEIVNEKPVSEPLPEAQIAREPIIIKKDDESESSLNAVDQESQSTDKKIEIPEQEQGFFASIGNFFKKSPFFAGQDDDSVEAEASKKDSEEIAKYKSTWNNQDLPVAGTNAPQPKKSTQKVVEKSTKGNGKNSSSSIPVPHLKPGTNIVSVEINAEKKVQEADAPLSVQASSSGEQEAPEKVYIQPYPAPNSQEEREILQPVSKELTIKSENSTTLDEKPEPAKDSMWQKFLDTARKKVSLAKSEDSEPNVNENPQLPIINNNQVALESTSKTTTSDNSENKSAENNQDSANSLPVNESIKKPVAAPQNKNPALPAANNATGNTPAVADAKLQQSSGPVIEDKIATSRKVLSEKLNKTNEENIASVPPIPESASEPLQVVTIPPQENVIKTPANKAEQQNAGNMDAIQPTVGNSTSLAFEQNNTEVDDSGKEKIAKIIKQISGSNKIIKVMSYAKGTEGDTNSSRRISLQRAMSVRTQIILAGFDKNRINVQAIGNNITNPELTNSVILYIVE